MSDETPSSGFGRDEERLSRYLDGELSAPELERFEADLQKDTALRDELRQWQSMRNRLRGAVHSAPVPATLESRVLERIAPVGHRSRFLPRGFWLPVAVLTMAAVVLSTTWLLTRERIYTLADFPPAVAAMMEIGVGKHVSCVKERIEGSVFPLGKFQSDVPPEYKRMLDAAMRALPADFQVVELHVCGAQDREFAHLTLSRGSGYLSVLLTERRPGDPAPESSGLAAASVGDVTVYAVNQDGLDVGVFALPTQYAFVVSDYGRKANVEFTKDVAGAIQ